MQSNLRYSEVLRCNDLMSRAESVAMSHHFYLGIILCMLVHSSHTGASDLTTLDDDLEPGHQVVIKADEPLQILDDAGRPVGTNEVFRIYKVDRIEGDRAHVVSPSVSGWVQTATLLHLPDAAEYYEKITRQNPNAAWAYSELGMIRLWVLRDPMRAEEALDQAIRVEPRSIPYLANRALIREERDNLDGALADYDAALAVDPRQPRVLMNRGNLWGRRGDFDRALKDFDSALEIDDQNPVLHFNRAAALRRVNRLDESVSGFDKAIELDSENPEFYMGRARTQSLRHHRVDARSDYEEALIRDPSDLDNRVEYSRYLVRLNDLEPAAEDLDEILEGNPDYAPAVLARSDIARRYADYEKARLLLLKIGDDSPYLLDRMILAGRIEIDRKAPGGTAEDTYFNKVLQADPSRIEALKYRGLDRLDRGMVDGAKSDLEAYVKLAPNDPEGLHFRGKVYLAQDDLKAALADLIAALALDPDDSWAYLDCGLTRFQQGDYARAIVDFDSALRIEPTYTAALSHRAAALGKLGRYGDQLDSYHKAVDSTPQNQSELNSLAWFLATCPDPRYRNGEEAVKQAQAALDKAYIQATILDTLAAALAECGRFDEALEKMEDALNHLNPNDEDLKKALHEHREQIRNKKPIREPQDPVPIQ
jgi:tetratricopeptide (TPR) repeat protein